MANKNKLSIYLIKPGIEKPEEVFKDNLSVKELKKYNEKSIAYYIPTNTHEPVWLRDFFYLHGEGKLLQANSKVVLLKRMNVDTETRVFAITFGYARFLFKDDVLEEQFGLRIILNSIQQNQIRRISKSSVGSNQKQSDEQLPKSSDISEFGFDINRDLMKSVSGKSEDEFFEKSMLTGGDIFSLTVSRDIENIDEFLAFCYKRYSEESYKERFAWIDNIKCVKNKARITDLNEKLIQEIRQKHFNNVWMAVPEVVSWEDIKDFKISGSKEFYKDINIVEFIDSLKKELTSVDQLKAKRIVARSSRDETQSVYDWSAYSCILAEISDSGQEYCLNNGKWYIINNDFAESINERYKKITLCTDAFPDYNHTNEDEYNSDLNASLGDSHLLHTYKISIGGGSGNNIEPCDVLWNNKLIHIKKNGGSSVLSHLFNQSLVSGQMLLDPNFRQQLRRKALSNGEGDVIPEPYSSADYEIVLAIINKFSEERPKIPFFSKVSICFVAQNISNLGYRLTIKNILMI